MSTGFNPNNPFAGKKTASEPERLVSADKLGDDDAVELPDSPPAGALKLVVH